MNKTEATEATAAIGMMLKAFPSSQSNISDDSARVYLFAVEEFSLEAIKRACRLFVRGEVKGRNNAFAPSAPELADVCKTAEGQIKVEQYESERVFIEHGSELWHKMLVHRKGESAPTFARDGKQGWFFSREDAAEAAKLALPPPPSEAQMQVNAVRLSALAAAKTFNATDDEAHDMGQVGAA
jgi:hypothetical protein